jgi:hypothetical protein
MIFLILCAFVVVSLYVLIQKYRQIRSYKLFSSNAQLVRNLESARALSSGVDTDQLWTGRTVSESATADLIGMHEGAASYDRKTSPFSTFPYEVRHSDDGHVAYHDHDPEGAMRRRTPLDENSQEDYFTPAITAFNSNEAFWTKQKQAGEELDQVRRNLRSRVIRPDGVTVGQVGNSAIAQRRRTTSNRSM